MLGCGAELFRGPNDCRLIDEYRFLVTPTVLGRGKSLFSAPKHGSAPAAASTPSAGGGMLMEYEPAVRAAAKRPGPTKAEAA